MTLKDEEKALMARLRDVLRELEIVRTRRRNIALAKKLFK